MTINHIDQLAQWWRDAEEGIGKAGDVVIERDDSPNFGAPSYVVFMLGRDEYENLTYRRILARAPKPKPAWHNAVAVIATWYDSMEDEAITGVWTHDAGVWKHEDGVCVDATALTDVTPLIEAKVTDEMVKRARATSMKWEFGGVSENAARAILTAALGIEAE